jgi:hypothetical protein
MRERLLFLSLFPKEILMADEVKNEVKVDLTPIPIPLPTRYQIKQICGNCGGTGQVTVYPAKWIDDEGDPLETTQVDCPQCEATGKIVWGELSA